MKFVRNSLQACVIWMKKDDIIDYVHDCYKVETYRNVYRTTILPMNGPDLWPKSSNPPSWSPSYLKNKERKEAKIKKERSG